ncbi:MAG TPA: ABC transporter ATP-binding protein [Acidimicrobiales bacterium]|nr:ABC transporter ATP-binding protein [Acidimicrobiales bacterium]
MATAPAPVLSTAALEATGVSKSFDAEPVLRDVSLRVEAGRMVALLGPSGCGKTTLLRVLAGLEVPDAGEVRLGDELLTGGGRDVPPERRRIGMVFQDWALFPHMSVSRNVAYGLPRGHDRDRQVGEALAMVGLAGLGDRAPATLSGGQQQRVALARALAPRPAALLLDEPFSNLDTALRVQVRTEVHRLLADVGVTTVFVTHDQDEAFVLGDEVAVMWEGEIVQQAPPAELYDHPRTPWIAGFVGDANLLVGQAGGGSATTVLGGVPLRETTQGEVQVLVRPEHLEVAAGDAGVVDLVEFYGRDTVYTVRLDGGVELTVRAAQAPVHARGDRVAVTYTGPPAVAFPVA